MISDPLVVEIGSATIRFAGDSGDGIQSIGKQMADTVIYTGTNIYTLTDFPAEIRAPAGTVKGVSTFKLCFSKEKILTVGDSVDTLVAFNPAALKKTIMELRIGGILITDINKFTEQDLKKAEYNYNPLLQEELKKYQLIAIPITELTKQALVKYNLAHATVVKCKNMFILGIIYYLYNLPLKNTIKWIQHKFNQENLIAANQTAIQAGYDYAAGAKLFTNKFTINNAKQKNSLGYITGNKAIVLGCIAIAEQAPKGLFAAGYPITPASDILQELAKYPDLQVITFQAEDEIAAISASLGAAFGGAIAITCTSGPGLDLKQEAIGLGVMAELPVIIVDVQRAGPSTGIPTKSEQSDLFAAMYGRHGESSIAVLAPNSPGDCFTIILEAAQIAIKYMIPVIVLSDAILANSAESWLVPNLQEIPQLNIQYCQQQENFQPYMRNPTTFARPWVIPGTPNLTHRIGGLEKKDPTSEISYDPANHDRMVRIRAAEINAIANDFPSISIIGDIDGKLLIIGWGSSLGVITTTINSLRNEGHKIAYIHLRYLNPLPNDLAKLLHQYRKIVVIEANLGQLTQILRAKYLIDVQLISKVTGRQFLLSELRNAILEHV